MLKIFLLLIISLNASLVYAEYEPDNSEVEVIAPTTEPKIDNKSSQEEIEEDEEYLHETILLYLPNRIFDLLDILRLRVRVGPGFDFGIRITEPVSLYLGGHSAIYLGLPGPRLEPTIPIPIGAEAVVGALISYLNGTAHKDTGPRHSETNVGVETQLILIGVDVGIDPVEIADFFTGLFLLDLRDDDF